MREVPLYAEAVDRCGWPSFLGGHFQNLADALEATQGQIDGFFGQLPYKCHFEEVAFEWVLTKETIYLPLGCLQGRGFGV